MPFMKAISIPPPFKKLIFFCVCEVDFMEFSRKLLNLCCPGISIFLQETNYRYIRKIFNIYEGRKKIFLFKIIEYFNYLKNILKFNSEENIKKISPKIKKFLKVYDCINTKKNKFQELLIFISKNKHKGCFISDVKNFSKNSRFVQILTKRYFSENILRNFQNNGILENIGWKCIFFTQKKKFKIKLNDEIFLENSFKKNYTKSIVPCLNCQFLFDCRPQGKINPYQCIYLA